MSFFSKLTSTFHGFVTPQQRRLFGAALTRHLSWSHIAVRNTSTLAPNMAVDYDQTTPLLQTERGYYEKGIPNHHPQMASDNQASAAFPMREEF